MNLKNPGKKYFLALTILLMLLSCQPKEYVEHKIILPPTPILSSSQSWAVVTDTYLKVTQDRDKNSKVTATLRKGEILEILTSELDGEGSLQWYQIRDDEISGWVYSTSVKKFENRQQAETASRETDRETS